MSLLPLSFNQIWINVNDGADSFYRAAVNTAVCFGSSVAIDNFSGGYKCFRGLYLPVTGSKFY